MGKKLNTTGKFGRSGIKDRSAHWKHGKGSGDGHYQERLKIKQAKRLKGKNNG